MQYTIISHTSACKNTVRRFFLSLHLITSHKNEMKFFSVLHQYYNKITFPQFLA